jgi:hypothetical protein
MKKTNSFLITFPRTDNPTFVDLDGDGDLDLVGGINEGDIEYYINEGTKYSYSFTAASDAKNPFRDIHFANGGVTSLFVDLDNDGDLDALLSSGTYNLVYYENGFCIPQYPCSIQGICGEFDAVPATCDCATGFQGDQCWHTLDGFYGTDADLCPGGGTKEVMTYDNICSTRGTCDDGLTGSGACTCGEWFSGSDCSSGSCPAGMELAVDFNSALYICESCSKGSFASSESNSFSEGCTSCPTGYYAPEVGLVDCEACPAGESGAKNFFSYPHPRSERAHRTQSCCNLITPPLRTRAHTPTRQASLRPTLDLHRVRNAGGELFLIQVQAAAKAAVEGSM